jgi:hypothetical protein
MVISRRSSAAPGQFSEISACSRSGSGAAAERGAAIATPGGLLHPHMNSGFDVDAHAVLGDQRVGLFAHDLHLQHVHVHRRVVVDERQHEGAPVDHHTLAEQTGAHEGDLLRGPVIEPVHQIDHDRDDDDRDDQPQDQLPDEHARHVFLPSGSRARQRGDPFELPRLLGQRDFHRQPPIEEAP